MNGLDQNEALSQRQKFVAAFNETMLSIWKDQISLLGVVDTGKLLSSPFHLPVQADGRFVELNLGFEFLEYGLWQELGVGREVPIGNPGDIGRDKARIPKRWLSPKFFSSSMNFRDFMADNLGQEFLGIMSSAFDLKTARQMTNHYKNK